MCTRPHSHAPVIASRTIGDSGLSQSGIADASRLGELVDLEGQLEGQTRLGVVQVEAG